MRPIKSLHHFVTIAEWSESALLAAVRQRVLPTIARHGTVRTLIVGDTGLPKKGRHYLPHEWVDDPARRAKAGVPEDIVFQTRPQIAFDQRQRSTHQSNDSHFRLNKVV